MRLLILSDLHREIYPNRDLGIDLTVSKPDVVILAGDIDKGPRSVKWASDTFNGLPVLYVAGNHEFYGANIDTVPDAIKRACDETKNVWFLDKEDFIYDGLRFLGATLWTDFCLFGTDNRKMAMVVAAERLSDYRAIRVAKNGYRKLHPSDTEKLHIESRSWLNGELDKVFPGKTI